jgi:hypothetical protein
MIQKHNELNTAEVWEIFPEDAERLLALKVKNRKLRERHLLRLTADMSAGNWLLNGEPLIFDYIGRLIDGQHRLTACIRANVPFTTFVINGGIAENSINSIDSGIARSPGDMLGFYDYVDSNHLAATCRWIYRYRTGSMQYEKTIVSRTDLLEMVQKNPSISDSIQYGRKASRFMSPSLASALHWLMSRKDKLQANAFFNDLAYGVDLSYDDPMNRLREALIRNLHKNAKLPNYHIAALTIKAWNLTRAGKKVKMLGYYPNSPSRPEPFPEIL